MDLRQIVAGHLRRLRGEQGLSQEAFADVSDVHRTYVSGVERGVRNPTIIAVAKIAKGLGVPIAALFAEAPPKLRR